MSEKTIRGIKCVLVEAGTFFMGDTQITEKE
jgi:hypothetical protein